MSTILVKIFATALVLSQVTTRPEAVKPEFDPVGEQAEVVQILRDGCAQMRKAFDIEDINLDDLIATAMDDPQALNTEIKALRGLELRRPAHRPTASSARTRRSRIRRSISPK